MTSKPLYNVWTDGSFNHSHHTGGAGWVIVCEGEETEGFRPMPKLPTASLPHGSDYAEILAVALALEEVPEGSRVTLRADCQNVLDWLKGGVLNSKPDTKKALQSVFNDAMAVVGKMESVEFIKVAGRQNDNLKKAHNLSRKGSNHARNPR